MAAIGRTEASSGSPDVIVSVMSKLLEDLVSRNDQARRKTLAHITDTCHPTRVRRSLMAHSRAAQSLTHPLIHSLSGFPVLSAALSSISSDAVSFVQATGHHGQELP